MISEKNQEKLVIQVYNTCNLNFHRVAMFVLHLLPVEEPYLHNRKTNKHENLHVYIFSPGVCTVWL